MMRQRTPRNEEVSNQLIVPDQERQPTDSTLAILENKEPLEEGESPRIRKTAPATHKFLCATLSAALVFSIFILNPILENTGSNLRAEEQQRRQEEQHEIFDQKNPFIQQNSGIQKNKKNDNSSLLSFTIIGFPKTGTTFLLNWIRCHPMICMSASELGTWKLNKQDDALLATSKALLALSPNLTISQEAETTSHGNTKQFLSATGACLLRGYKSPGQLYKISAFAPISRNWPRAKLIVGVRHPVLWFQSYYNFRLRRGAFNENNQTILQHVMEKGFCAQGVCADNGKFHVFLSYVGKTPLVSDDERSLFQFQSRTTTKMPHLMRWKKRLVQTPPIPNRIFLVDLAQLDASKRPLIFDQFRRDLSQFLGLPTSSWLETPHRAGREKRPDSASASSSLLDICQPRYREFRLGMLEIGGKAAKWILEYFVHSPDVTVSSPKFFEEQLRHWEYDPCQADVVPDVTLVN